MKRKIIKQAGQAYTLTLPIDWIRNNKLDEKSEVDVAVSGKTLLVNTNNQTLGGKISMNVEEIDSNRTIYMILNALYAKGVDEIELISSKEITPLLTEAANNLLGFALISREKERYTIKDISPSNYSNIDEIFKRVFQIVLLFYEDATGDIIEHKGQTLDGLQKRDLEVNKFCLLLQRAINKKVHEDTIDGRVLFTYSFALEEIGDEIMRLWRSCIKYKLKTNKDIVEMFDLCRKQLEESFDSYYLFNIKRMKQAYLIREKIREKILNQKIASGKEAMLLKHVLRISEGLVDLTHLNIMMKLK